MAFTDTDSLALMGMPVPVDERRIHDAALVLHAYNAVHATVVTISQDLKLLAISSVWTGLMLFEWRFSQVRGLEAASALAVDADGSAVFVAGAASRGVALVTRERVLDSLARDVRSLTWLEAWSDRRIDVNRLRASQHDQVEGLAGVVKLQLLPANCSFSPPPREGTNAGWYAECLTLFAYSQPPRYNLPCGPIPPEPVPDSGIGVSETPGLGPIVPARCHEPAIAAVRVSHASLGKVPVIQDNALLFPSPPELSFRGVMRLAALAGAYGDAAFALVLLKERQLSSVSGVGNASDVAQAIEKSRSVTVTVEPVRYKPTFDPVNITVNEDAGAQVLKFATNVLANNAAGPEDQLLNYKWRIIDVSCTPFNQDTLFKRGATSSTLSMSTYLLTEKGGLNGVYFYVGYGAVRFEWAPHQSGECRITVSVYDPAAVQWESDARTFVMRTRPVNDPPSVKMPQNVSIQQGIGRTRIPQAITCLTWLPDGRPAECDIPGMCVPAQKCYVSSQVGGQGAPELTACDGQCVVVTYSGTTRYMCSTQAAAVFGFDCSNSGRAFEHLGLEPDPSNPRLVEHTITCCTQYGCNSPNSNDARFIPFDFGPGCGTLAPTATTQMSVKNVRGAYCRPVQQGTCWYSIRIEGFEKVGNANGPPWPEVASRKLIDARSVLRDLVFEMDTIVIEMDPKAFGLFRLTVSFTDKDDGRGGNNTAVQQVWLEVKAVAIPPSINMPSAEISTIPRTPTLVPTPPSSTPSESTAASSASQGGDGTSSSPPLYDALTARDEEEFDQAMIQAKFMADLRELPLGNLSALNLMVVEMKEALVQHYPDFLDVTSGSPEQMSVTDLTSTITNLSSSHLFAGGTPAVYGAFPEPTTRCVDVSQAPECAGGDLSKASCLKLVAGCNAKRLLVNQSCSGCPVLGVDGRPGSLSFTLAPYRYGIASMTVRFEFRSRLSSLASVVSTYKLDIVVLPVNDPPSADVTPFLGLAQGAEEVVIPFFVTNISVGPENEVWQKPVFHVQSEVDTPGLLTHMPEIDERGTLAMRLWPSMHGRIRMRVMLSDTGGIAYGGRNSSSKFPVTAEIKVFALPTIFSVSPCVGTAGGGWTITIRGNFFGSAYTTEGKAVDGAQISGAVRVHVGKQPCKNTRFVSDTLLVCDVPKGVRRREVQVTVPGGQSFNPQGRLLSSLSERRGMYVPGVVAAHIYVAGSAGGAKSAVYPWPQTPADIEGKKEERVCSVCRARIALVDISTNTASDVTNASNVTPPTPVGRTRLTSWIPFCNWTNTSVRTGNKTSWETRLTLDAVKQISEYLGLGA